ncbi:MAG TPA: FtsW/RodA/SpoVE family cell cycle protein, partial [Rhodothermales bacterium]|nr:FtsW/RodA/SpoVE family cell cycle protein [Rhodothermales bacterium]
GTGPTGSEGAKVNLVLGPLTVQPVEVIKACLLVFFAGYFARNWEFLRNLEESKMPGWLRRVGLSVPRLRFALPVLLGVGLAIGFFILQRDLGPALVICTTFLLLYGIVRRRWLVVGLGFAALVGSFWLVYHYELVPTVVSRVAMMLSPWDNSAGGGEHLAQAIWSLTTGGFTGQGLGDGNTLVVPAAHTDMVMAIVGEELGLLGFLGVLLLYAVLFHRGLLVALRSGSLFGFFLGAGIVISSALQLGLIVGGMLGVVPLSGVVSPLLSYGKSALIMHLLFIGVLLNLSGRDVTAEEMKLQRNRFAGPVGAVGVGVLVMLGLLGLRTAYIQVIKVDDWIVKPALVPQADGKRGFAYNPRIRLALDRIRLGTLYDRNGIPLATSDPSVLTDSLMEVDLSAFRRSEQERIYPFGPLTTYLLGDYNKSGGGWGDVRGLYAERRFLSQLRGYDNRPDRGRGTNYAFELPDPDDPDATYTVSYYDYRELVPYLRAGLGSRKSRRFFEAKRDHRLSIDIRLQERVAEAIRAEVGRRPDFQERFISAAVIDVHTGEVLAAVTYPLPEDIDEDADDEQLYDHALYANKPPGSTFKLATAMAAFREMGNEAADWETSVGGGERFMRIEGPTGTVSMALAIENSSNVYFARLAEETGAEEMLNVMDAIGVRNGFEDGTRQEEVEALTRYTNLQQAGFGQGLVIASPLAVARMASIPANEGRLAQTRWLVADDSLTTGNLDSTAQQVITLEQARILAQYMRNVVIGPRGTGRRLSTLSVPVAGKTGTAEQDLFENGRNLGRVTHAWFTGYAPYTEQPSNERQIAVAVLVESGKQDLGRDNLSGGRDAGPIAGAIFEAAADLGLIHRSEAEAPPAGMSPSTVAPADSSAVPDTSTVTDSTNVALND